VRYSLRALIIATLVIPPVIGFVWWAMAFGSSEVPMSAIVVVLIVFIVVTAIISGPPPDWR
jgi:hypothetical protein